MLSMSCCVARCAASRIAAGIARGNLSETIAEPRRNDEASSLIRSLATMQVGAPRQVMATATVRF